MRIVQVTVTWFPRVLCLLLTVGSVSGCPREPGVESKGKDGAQTPPPGWISVGTLYDGSQLIAHPDSISEGTRLIPDTDSAAWTGPVMLVESWGGPNDSELDIAWLVDCGTGRVRLSYVGAYRRDRAPEYSEYFSRFDAFSDWVSDVGVDGAVDALVSIACDPG